MFLVLIIPAFLSPSWLFPVVGYQVTGAGRNFSVNNSSVSSSRFPQGTKDLISRIKHLGHKHPDIKRLLKDSTRKSKHASRNDEFTDYFDREPARVPNIHSKDYGESSYYRIKGGGHGSSKSMYKSLIQKLLKPKSSYSPKNGYTISDISKYTQPISMSETSALSSPAGWGWHGGGGGSVGGGWGWGKGHKDHHGYGISVVDLLLAGLTLLSLGGFLLNLLLNLLNLFGFGFMTTTSTSPVTATQTATTGGGAGGGTATTGTGAAGGGAAGGGAAGGGGIGGGGAGGGITVSGLGASALSSGLGFSGRTSRKGWGKNKAHISGHIQLPTSGGNATTAAPLFPFPLPTLFPPLPPLFPTIPPAPTITGTVTAGTGVLSGTGLNTGFALRDCERRKKREVFEPYVDIPTSLDTLARAVLNSIGAARNKYECMESIACENNRQARVVGRWLEYFMPVYSFSLSYIGHRMGAHNSLLDHSRAIVLGAAETNCQAHFPRCEQIRPDP